MPGRRTPTRRGGTPIGGDTPVAQGSLVLSDAIRFLSIDEGDSVAFTGEDEVFSLSNGGPGNWHNPQYSIGYSGVTGWLTLLQENVGGVYVFTPVVDASALTASVQTATVTFTDTNVTNSPQAIDIQLTVAVAGATMSLSPTDTLDFSVVDETAVGAGKTITVTNVGAGTLATPTVGTVTGAGAAYIDTVDIAGSAGGPFTVTVYPTTIGGTVGGPYQAVIPILASGATNSPLNILANITVTSAGSAVIRLDRSLDDRSGTVGGANPLDLTVGVTSANVQVPLAGPQVDSVTYSGAHSGFLTATFGGALGTTLTGTFDISGISTDGSSIATVTISDANASATETWEVVLNMGTAAAPATIILSPSSISRNVLEGANAAQETVTIANGGAGGLAALGTLSAQFVAPQPTWASLSLQPSTGVVTITFQSSALAVGTYSATIQIGASLATNTPRNLALQLVVASSSSVYSAPVWALPSFVTHNASDDLLSGEPFTAPALGSFS